MEVMRISTSCRWSKNSLYGTAEPLRSSASLRARVRSRLATIKLSNPSLTRHCRVSSPISPAPRTIPRRPRSDPNIFRASSTAADGTEAAPSAIRVSARTRLPTPSAFWNNRFKAAPTAG